MLDKYVNVPSKSLIIGRGSRSHEVVDGAGFIDVETCDLVLEEMFNITRYS